MTQNNSPARLAVRLAAAATIAAVTAAAIPAAATPSARSELYSVGSTDRFCSRAQQISANTLFYSYNIVHTHFDSFTNSSAAPYVGANTGAYNGTIALYPNGQNMGLITQQFVSQRELGATQWEYPIVISCKMKTAEAINAIFGAGSAGDINWTRDDTPSETDGSEQCKTVNQDTVARVYSTLTSIEQRTLRWTQSQIFYTVDEIRTAGPAWLYPLPYIPQVAFIRQSDGRLALRGIRIKVLSTDPSTQAGYDKKGSFYCHLPSPEYVRAMVTGQTNPIIENPPEE